MTTLTKSTGIKINKTVEALNLTKAKATKAVQFLSKYVYPTENGMIEIDITQCLGETTLSAMYVLNGERNGECETITV